MTRKSLGLACLLTTLPTGALQAQTQLLEGDWIVIDAPFRHSTQYAKVRFDATGGATVLGFMGGDGQYGTTAETGCRVEGAESQVSFPLFSVSWTARCDSGPSEVRSTWTVAGVAPRTHLLRASVNSAKAPAGRLLSACVDGSACSYMLDGAYMRRAPVRVAEEGDFTVGAYAAEVMEVERVSFTDRTIEMLLNFEAEDGVRGTLHPPGAEFAYFLRDTGGNTYLLLDQLGWRGDGASGFGTFQVRPGASHLVLLVFEGSEAPKQIEGLSLVEGGCTDGCWHAYDIRLHSNR